MHNETLHNNDAGSAPAGFTPPAIDTSRHAAGTLLDKYGRRISYIRLSITDRCDFRCFYCMAEEMTFLPRSEVLSLEECLAIVRAFADLGVYKVRITGGEPLVRKDATWLLRQINQVPGIRELVLTTNGSQLERFAPELQEAGVKRINVSLDTLDPLRFHQITRTGDLAKVLGGIDAALAAGISRVKLNTVMMRGMNDHEFPDLVRYAMARGIDISFIEEMPLGEIGHGRAATYFSTDEALDLLGRHFPLEASDESSGGPARYWRIPGSDTRVGFISPHSHNFCDTCNRVRITAKGELYPCLGHNDAVQLLPLLRAHPDDPQPLVQAITGAMGIKPKAHDFTAQMESPQVVRFMSMTGG